MSTLKSKLAEKVEIINCNHSNLTDITNHTNNNISLDVPSNNSEGNIIMLKPQESNYPISVIPDFVISINEAKERIAMLQNFVKEMMILNVDYGLIPRCDKPSLFKSGAEKLCDIFGFSKHIEVINRLEDWENGLFHYEVKATLINKKTGFIEAEGIGSCNNRERKYKNQDSYSIINTILKMAKKRALIDSVLSATRSSGIFTQDMEDLDETPNSNITRVSERNRASNKNYNQSKVNSNNKAQQKLINKSQQNMIFSIIAEKKLPIDEIKSLMIDRYKVSESKSLSDEQALDFINFLKVYNII